MIVVSQIDALRDAIGAGGRSGRGPTFVPTMGALHEGHLALMRRARELGRPVVISIFLNPTQFGPDEDLHTYPCPREADLEAAQRVGVDIAFAPAIPTIYPPGVQVPVPPLPEVATRPGLEDAHRPGHFNGVCQVVARLLDLVQPAVAVFGEKDYQQLLVVQAMVAQAQPERWTGLEIVPHPTVRDPDGLALSSRNAHLPRESRESALGLRRALEGARGSGSPEAAERLMEETLRAHGLEIDYAVVRDPRELLPVATFDRPARGLIAARLGPVRLIDNGALP